MSPNYLFRDLLWPPPLRNISFFWFRIKMLKNWCFFFFSKNQHFLFWYIFHFMFRIIGDRLYKCLPSGLWFIRGFWLLSLVVFQRFIIYFKYWFIFYISFWVWKLIFVCYINVLLLYDFRTILQRVTFKNMFCKL